MCQGIGWRGMCDGIRDKRGQEVAMMCLFGSSFRETTSTNVRHAFLSDLFHPLTLWHEVQGHKLPQ